MSPVINFVLIHCSACGELRKAQPEKVYEPSSLEWPRVRPLECPHCSGQMKPVPEYLSPSWPARGMFPFSNTVEWMV